MDVSGLDALAQRCLQRLAVEGEHLDRLRLSEVRAAFAAARAADSGPAGEAARQAHRARSRAFLERETADLERELARRRSASGCDVDLELELVVCGDPDERARTYGRRERAEDGLRGLREEWWHARDEAARRAGAADEGEFLAAEHPVDPVPLARWFESGAIAPLDEAVDAAARAWRNTTRLALIEPEHPADGVLAAALAEHAASVPRGAIAPWLRSVGAVVGADPDSTGAALRDAPRGRAWSAFIPAPGRGTLALGWLSGPGALRRALGELGRGMRAGFVLDTRGPAALLWSDPAFAEAVAVVFGRLALDPVFLERFGPRLSSSASADLQFEEALAPRLAWAYVGIAMQRAPAFDDHHAAGLLRRASGRAATFEQRWHAARDPGLGAARLRGIVLGLLLEERLRTRFGRSWCATRAARSWLREAWEAEHGATVESLARGLDLGTMDPAPILDRCRPAAR